MLEEFSDPILLSIDADEVCLNPVEFAAELRAHPSDRAFWARWRTIVHDDGDYAVGPWSKSEPDGPIKPGWSACSGFQISGRGEFAGNGRATVEARPPRRSCGMFLHRSWDVVTARAKLRAWRRDVDRGDVFAAALEVMHRCRGDLVRLNGAIHGLRNWGPYPNAPWESYAIWDSDDVAKLEARPFFIGSENEEEP